MPVAERTERKSDIDILLESLAYDALTEGSFTLSNGQTSDYYVDAKAALLRGPVCSAVARLIAAHANSLQATAVGGLTMGADPLATGAIIIDESLLGFFVRKERKKHGLQKWIEGPRLTEGTRCLVVDDVVTTGSSTVDAIDRCLDSGLEIAGTICVLDRLSGGREKIESSGGAPFTALATIDEIRQLKNRR